MFEINTEKKVVVFTLLVTVLIWYTGMFIPKYNNERPILFESNFPGNKSNWKTETAEYASINEFSVVLRASSDSRNKLTYTCPAVGEDARLGKIQVSASVVMLEPGDEGGVTSVLGFWFVNQENEIVSYRNIHILPGRYKNAIGRRVIAWPADATGCVFGLIANAGGPTIEISDGRVESVSAKQIYHLTLILLGLLIIAYAFFLLFMVQGTLPLLHLVLPTVLMLILLAGVMLTGPLLVKYIHPALFWVAAQLKPIFGDFSGNHTGLSWAFKAGHALLFFAITLYFFCIRQRIGSDRISMLIVLLLLAVATEGIQLHLQDRGASGLDVLFNWSGILLAWVVYEGGSKAVRTLFKGSVAQKTQTIENRAR